MKLTIRSKLFLLSTALIGICVLAADAYLVPALDEMITDRIRADLTVRAQLIAGQVSSHPMPLDDLRSWDLLADEAGRRAEGRVTLVRRDGVVLGDSEVELSEISKLESHADRPEILAAYEKGVGDSTRYSATLRQRMLYVAVPFTRDGVSAGVARVATPLTSVDAAIARLRHTLLIAFVVALTVAVLVSSVVAHSASRSVVHLTQSASRMAAGDLNVRTRLSSRDEFGELGRVLNQLVEGLSKSLGELRDERDHLGGILEGMEEGVVLLDTKGRIALINSSLREMLLLGANALGKPLLDVIRNSELKAVLDHAQRTGSASGEIEISGLKPRHLILQARRMPNHEEIVAVLFDVTEIRRIEAIRREFVANASHELRTPVASIRAAAETLQESLDDPASARKFAEMIGRNAERLQHLAEDLLDLTRIESRELQLHLEPLDLRVVLSSASALFKERAERRRLHLLTSFTEGLPLARGDRRALEQVLSNLLDNAVKYATEGATVTLSAATVDDGVMISVSDTGPGIETRHLDRLFERFYRADPGRAREMGGSGLGLAIVKHLVEAMGGEIKVESTYGHGSTFSFTLQRAS